MTTRNAALLPGTLDLPMLEAVSLGPLRGDGALLRIEQMSGGAILVEQGALDPAPHRLETDALLTAGMTVALAARREEV